MHFMKWEGIGKCDDTNIDKKQLVMGIRVEMEHTKDKRVARCIAIDHLHEIPDYYTRLRKMEREGERYWEKKKLGR